MAANNKVEPGVPPPPQYTPYPPQVGQGPAYGAQPGYPPQAFVPMGAQQQSMNNSKLKPPLPLALITVPQDVVPVPLISCALLFSSKIVTFKHCISSSFFI